MVFPAANGMNRFFYPALSLIIAVGLYFFYIAPGIEEMNTLAEKEKKFDEALVNIRQVESTLDTLENTYRGISREEMMRLDTFLPSEIDVTHTMQDIEGIASLHGAVFKPIEVKHIPPGPESTTKISKHIFTFDLLVPYEAFRDILADMEKSLQLADLQSLIITTPEAGEVNLENLPKFTVRLTMYSYK